MTRFEPGGWCDDCRNHYEGFCACQVKIIRRVEAGEKVEVPMGKAHQPQINEMRKRLQNAALKLTTLPIEIITLGMGNSEVKFLVRRFV